MPSSYRYSVIMRSHKDPDFHREVGVGMNINQAQRRLAAIHHVIDQAEMFAEIKEEALA